jgi:hypothetical protein
MKPNGTPQPKEPPQPVVLPTDYDDCIIGHSLHPSAYPRFAYSLTKLAKREQRRQNLVSLDAARASIWELVTCITRDHGDRAPLFIDDTHSVEDNTPRIIVPFGR